MSCVLLVLVTNIIKSFGLERFLGDCVVQPLAQSWDSTDFIPACSGLCLHLQGLIFFSSSGLLDQSLIIPRGVSPVYAVQTVSFSFLNEEHGCVLCKPCLGT